MLRLSAYTTYSLLLSSLVLTDVMLACQSFNPSPTRRGWRGCGSGRGRGRGISSSSSSPPRVGPRHVFGEDAAPSSSPSSSLSSTKKTIVKKKAKQRPAPPPRTSCIWEHAWVANGERRNKIKSLIAEMERQHFKQHHRSKAQPPPSDWHEVKECLDDGMQILVQWAQLGEGAKCQRFAEQLIQQCPAWMKQSNLEYHDYHVKVYRRVLHAHYNQLQRITWNGHTKKPKFQLTDREAKLGRSALQDAEAILQTMEQWSREYRKQSIATASVQQMPLVDAADYAPLIFGYNQVGQKALSALSAFRRLTDLYQSSGYLERLAPSTSLYIAVSKAVLNQNGPATAAHQTFVDRTGMTPIQVVSQLCRECIEQYNSQSQTAQQKLQPTIVLYNLALDAWSKALRPPTKSRMGAMNGNYDDASSSPSSSSSSSSSPVSFFVDEAQVQAMEEVAANVSYFWENLQQHAAHVTPNTKTFTSLIYAYTKANRLDRAHEMVGPFMKSLIPVTGAVVRVDVRALRMLASATARALDGMDERDDRRAEYAQRVEQILDHLWELGDAGYSDVVLPDVYLYTTAVNAWAMAGCSESALRAQMLVDDIKARYAAAPVAHQSLKPDIGLYNSLIKAIARQPGLKNAADKAGSIVRDLVKSYKETNDESIRPDVFTYNALIQACLASPDDLVKAEQTLDRMILSGSPAPNEKTYGSVIYALLKDGVPGGTARAATLLDRMEERFLPRASLYECIIKSFCLQAGMATRAQNLLTRMELLFEAHPDDESLRPNRELYNAVITALEDEGLPADAVREKRDETYGSAIINQKLRSNNQVFSLLKEVNANLAGGTSPSGNTYNFNQVLAQLANSGKVWAGLRAEDVLNYMLELAFKRKNRAAAPDIVTFNTVMAAWAKNNHALAGQRAAEVLKKLDDLHDMGLLEEVIADRVTYNTLMSAHAKSDDTEGAGRNAQACFDKLKSLYEETSDERYKPDVVSYATLLSAWARTRNEPEAGKRAEEILKQMFADHTANPSNPKPNTACFNEVLYAWARSGKLNAAKRAEMVLHLMEDMVEHGDFDVVPDTRTYNIVLLALANSPSKDSPVRAMQLLDDMKQLADGSQPDAVSYNTAISAFTKKGKIDSALALLDSLYKNKKVVLDSKFFCSLMNSLAETEASDAPAVAQGIVYDLLENTDLNVKPTTEMCNALIKCWGRCHRKEAPFRAEVILSDMMSDKVLHVEPDVITYTSIIDLWAKSGDSTAPDHVQALLDRMTVSPNVKTYTAAIQAYARSDMRDKAKRAQDLLQQMKEEFGSGNRDAEPSIYTYNAVLNAAEYTVGRQEDLESAFKVACETFDEVRSSETLKPDHVTYGSFMGVISTLMPKSDLRNDMIQLVFRRCCVDGQLSGVVMKKFKEAADTAQIRQLMGNVPEGNIPKEWTFNIRGARQ